MKQSDANHKSNQQNPNNPAHQRVNDNRSDQRNPNNLTYSRTREAGKGEKNKTR